MVISFVAEFHTTLEYIATFVSPPFTSVSLKSNGFIAIKSVKDRNNKKGTLALIFSFFFSIKKKKNTNLARYQKSQKLALPLRPQYLTSHQWSLAQEGGGAEWQRGGKEGTVDWIVLHFLGLPGRASLKW
jgi:hypothetical protein